MLRARISTLKRRHWINVQLSFIVAPMATISTLDTLNPAQRAAARYGERAADNAFRAGPLLIIAGAGTGKTNTLAHRVAHLVLEGVSPQRILLLTFTRRAAVEMTRRAQRIVGEVQRGSEAAVVGHLPFDRQPPDPALRGAGGAGCEFQRARPRRCGGPDGRGAPRARADQGGEAFPRKDTCLAIYSHRVNTQRPLAETLANVFPWCAEWEAELTGLYRAYVEKKLANQALDYDDLLLYWHAMTADAGLAREIGAQFDQILVDEYQDTNVLQAGILKALRPSGEGLTVVGDDAQSIYSFRAATVENILGFPAQYAPPAAVVTLEENYRSTQGILDAANALIAGGARQYRKTLTATRGAGGRPRYVTVLDDLGQAQYVVTRVLETRERGVPLRRQAVLFRSSHHSDVLELELVRRNIPYVKYGGLKFLEAAHVKDALSVLRWADNPKNRIAAFRALQLMPGIGPAAAAKCFDAFEANAHAWASLKAFAPPALARDAWPAFAALMGALAVPEGPWQGQMGRVREWYEPHLARLHDAAQVRAGDLLQLERIAQQFGTRERFLSELALDPAQASGDLAGAPLLDEDYLVLSTIHSAKGQEWDAVYLLNVADGNFPSEFSTGRPS